MKEIWKDIKGYEGQYQVNNYGKVKSLDRWTWNGHAYFIRKGKILKPSTDAYGYSQVGLSDGTKQTTKKVHRLVAEAFIPNPDNFEMVNHLDYNRKNNIVANLEWTDAQGNNDYSLSKGIYVVFPDNSMKYFKSGKECARQLNIAPWGMWNVLKGKRKYYKGLQFQYKLGYI